MTDNSQALMMALQAGSLYGPNKWSQFPNGIQSTSYSGTPTNALGQPIQQPPGMTLNQTPQQPAAPMQQAAPQQSTFQHATMSDGMPYGQTNLGRGVIGTSWQGPGGGMAQQDTPQQSAPQPAPSSPTNSYQNALQLLSNPGHVTTPGANVAATQPITQQPSVLDQFLATQQGGTGAGGYSNQGFFNTLNKLKGNNAPAVADANTAPTALSPGANMTNQLAGVKPQVRRA
jgi:hypothetical protein